MEDKIEVNEYVRTKDGIIAKLVDLICGQDACFDNEIICKSFDMTLSDFELNHIDIFSKAFSEVIVKHSKNVIKLIKEGDYVNGMEVYKGKTASGKEKLLVGNHIINGMTLELVNIKSIITKEQFESIKYEI